MEATQKHKNSQGKKTNKKKTKNKSEEREEVLLEDKLENLTKELGNVNVLIDNSYSRTTSETNIENDLQEAFKDSADETVGLLDDESKDNLDVSDTKWLDSGQLRKEIIESQVKSYLQRPNKSPDSGLSTSDTELDEIKSLPRHSTISDFQIDTKFESPQRVAKSFSVEHVEELPDILEPEPIGSIDDIMFEIASEVSPSAPILDSVFSQNLEHKDESVEEVKAVESCFTPLSFLTQEEETIKPYTFSQLTSLYLNSELDENTEFIDYFVESELRGGEVMRHPLYEILVGYLRARGKLTANKMELETLKNDCREHQAKLWTLQKHFVIRSGECQDGNPVEANHEFQVSHFDKASATKLSRSLSAIKDLVNESYALNAYTCEVLKLQVEHYIQNISAEFSFLPHNSPVNLVSDGLPAFSNHTGRDLRVVISDLRLAISVLFSFQRRPIKDQGFIADTRQWLSKLVAVMLRVATWRDHMFILNHVLRCPAGVSHWATTFIQPPPCPHNSPFSSEHLDHLVTTLATILLPVKQRDQFLSNYSCTVLAADCKVPVGMECTVTLMSETDSLWVMVDSEGEDEIEEGDEYSFKENDIVALLNQIPFDAIYRQVLQITRRDEQDFYDANLISDHHVLRLMAFCSILINLLEKGLSNHSSIRYKQFAKRLGRLVRHTTQYATDQWQAFRNDKMGTDPAMIERLQVEYDALVMRAAKCLYNTPGRTTWQFLAVLPFSSVTLRTLWKLFCLLLQGDDEPIDETRWQERLEERLSELSDADIYYLLTTVATMAMARNQQDFLFIKAAMLQLLEIGFLNVTTREHCSKSARIMLANLSTKHPALISVLLEKLHTSSQVGKLVLYLVKELPLGVWKPTDPDLTILEDWLSCPIISIRNNVARYIITHLNWGFVSVESQGNVLFLPYSIHVKVAMMNVKVSSMFCPSSPVGSGSITDSVRQMSSLASSMVRPNSSEQALIVWLWQTVYKLHLHLTDQSDTDIKHSLLNPLTAFTAIPDLESESQELEVLNDGVQKQQVMAMYVALQLTTIGHNVPLICTQGFSMVSVLQSYHLHTAVISLLQNIIPLFLDCPESLTTNEKFSMILTNLLGADRTYFKVAKSLIAPDFPGHILAQFGNMVQYHLLNYKRYCLTSPAAIVDIWMKCLCNVWKDEPTSVGYLMDIIISTAFFQPDVSCIVYDSIALLLQNISMNSQTNSRLSSLFSWISIGGSGTVVSLVPQGSSCPYTPWFAYFALQVEEIHVQGSNGLWKEVLKELASVAGKPSVDNAVKRSSATLKIPQPPSSALSIYRWSQQALDTPVDHPVLPLLWQRFFMLYFTKVPSVSGIPDRGSVGNKFFEGMTNITYTKKLKRKLFDCSEYYNTKSESTNQQVSQDRQTLFGNLAKLYRTLSLWLEEPKLHEPGLYFPGLPPQYSPIRLASIASGDQGPWYEFVDYESVCNSHQSKVESWMQTLGRSEDMAKSAVPQFQEDSDPVQRIIKRLDTYDRPLLPPPLQPCQPIVPSVTRDALLYKGIMLDSLKDSFKSLLDFAQVYYLRTSEHTALNCSFLELVPTLFVNSENQVKLLAACDTIDPEAKSNMTPPPANSLNCAGPAVIYITVCSARENGGVGHQIQLNRVEMEGLLKRSLQPPPTAVCVASIYIEHLTQALERECLELKRIGDVQMLSSVQGVGIILFYHISSMFNDEAMSYPPIKQLFTSCIEILGQSFISGETNQCVRLLSEVFQNPRISGLLCPHFTPSSADANTFLSIYSNVVDMEESAPTDLLFVLLTKFDVSQWLLMKRPRLVERSQLIELVGKALAMAGQTPPDEKLMLQEVYRRHLSTLFLYDFPEHYGEILNLTLRYSETQTLAIGVWFDIVNSLSGAKFRPGMSLGQVKEEIHRYAREQKALSLQELRDTASLFGSHFTKERLQYGLYGLYPKYRTYIEPLTTLLGMIAHALIVTTLQNDRGTLSDKLCEQLWPSLSGLFSPWLAPYFTRHLAEPTAAWIQQLTEDRSVLPPWIVADGGHAHKMAAMFTETVRFILDTLPACNNILSFLWQFYVTSYAHSSIKDHILNVMHGNLLTLPWQRFFPTLQDLDFMLKVVDQYLPDCHTFLGAIFIEISWKNWVTNICASCPAQVTTKTHGALLHLLIKLANEPNVRQSPKITSLLLESQQFSWHLIECNNYESVTNWFVMSYDPRVILQLTKEDWNGIDMAALDLLQVAGGFTSTATSYHPSTPRKRQVFIRATVKLLLSCLSKYKPLATSRQDEVKKAIRKMVDKVEIVISATAPGAQKASEAGLLMVEILTLVNQPSNSPVSEIALDALLSWLSTRSSTSVVVAALLRSLGTTVANQEILGTLLEAALTAFFRRGVGEPLTTGLNWSIVVSILQPIVPRHPPLEESLVTCGHLLSLYALVLKNLPSTYDIREEAIVLHNLTEWIANVKPNESMENKLPLLWSKVLSLSHRQCEFSTDSTTGVRYLQKLVQAVTQNAEHRAGAGWGLLGAIGICKTQTITNKCRFLSRVLAALVLVQLPVKREENSEQSGQFVRIKPHSPGSVISTNGEYCPSAEALKALSTLESLTADKNYAEFKTASDFALKLIRHPENSLHNADQVFINITLQIYNDNFLHALSSTPVA